jgi:uncharacterized protein (DUF3820 family)
MKRLKVLDNKKLRITEELEDGTVIARNTYKGVLIGDVPHEYTAWFNYKGLTYILY